MRKILMGVPLLVAGTLVISPTYAAAVSSTFDTGSEGWMVGDIDNVAQPMESPTYHPTGGSPGGYISTTDDYDIVGFFAPGAYTGNKSAYYGGTLSFDLSDAQSDGVPYPALFLYGDGQVISIAGGPPGTSFTHFSFNLTQAGFDVFTPSPGNETQGSTPVSEATFKAVLGDLTNVAIEADWHSGPDLTALDNVTLATAAVSTVPLPASAPMFGAALVALGAVGYSLKRKGKAAAAA